MSLINKDNKKETIETKQTMKKMLRYNIKNDTFYLFVKAFHSIDHFFLFIYSNFSLYLNTKNKITKYPIKKSFYIMFFFSFFFILVLNENINISTDLLINAYFNDSQITHISYDKIIKGKFNQNNHNSNNKYSYNCKNNNCQGLYNFGDNNNNQDF